MDSPEQTNLGSDAFRACVYGNVCMMHQSKIGFIFQFTQQCQT